MTQPQPYKYIKASIKLNLYYWLKKAFNVLCYTRFGIFKILKAPGACIIKLITVVIYGFRYKLDFLSRNTRLGCKGLPVTNTLLITETVNYGRNEIYDTGPTRVPQTCSNISLEKD
jgi:hypothetical protein